MNMVNYHSDLREMQREIKSNNEALCDELSALQSKLTKTYNQMRTEMRALEPPTSEVPHNPYSFEQHPGERFTRLRRTIKRTYKQDCAELSALQSKFAKAYNQMRTQLDALQGT